MKKLKDKMAKTLAYIMSAALVMSSAVPTVVFAEELTPATVVEAVADTVIEAPETDEAEISVITEGLPEEVLSEDITDASEDPSEESFETAEELADGEVLEDEEILAEEVEIATPSDAELASASDAEIASPSESRELTWSDGKFKIIVSIPEGAFDEEDEISLKVEPITGEALEELLSMIEEDLTDVAAYDVKLIANGEETEPGTEVSIRFEKVSSVLQAEDAAEEISVYHFAEGEETPEKVETEADAEEDTIEISLDSLSPILLGLLGSSLGDMWPATYGNGADVFDGSHGDGLSQDTAFEINSVEDLQAFALQVASDTSKASAYYVIEAGTYDLGGSWIPVGFPKNAGGSYSAFKGKIYAEDGAQIKNLGFSMKGSFTEEMAEKVRAQKYLGFFGEVGSGAVITNLSITTSNSTIQGQETKAVGILAGYADGATIKECSVTGSVKGNCFAGGLVGHAKSCHIEDSYAGKAKGATSGSPKLSVFTTAATTIANDYDHAGVGGLIGLAESSSIIDTYVATNDDINIYGKDASVGGVAGILEDSDILNSHVEQGRIGSSDSYANGGLVGIYNGGLIQVARMAATVANPSSGSNYAGTFIGTKAEGAAGITYGADKSIAFLFTDSQEKAMNGICGGKSALDGVFTYDAHIGYWHAADNYYSLVEGASYKDSDNYFYEELEFGINKVKYYHNTGSNVKTINHYSCNDQGRPVRGYLFMISNPIKSGVTVATLTAYLNGTYKNTVTADNLGAFPEGADVRISLTQPAGTHYVLDTSKVDNPYYTYYEADGLYVYSSDTTEEGVLDSGGYHITMPASDLTLSADYVYIADTLDISPNRVIFELTQTRSGKREDPSIKWTVSAKDSNGYAITDGIGTAFTNKEITTVPLDFKIATLINNVANKNVSIGFATSNAGSNYNGNQRASSNAISLVTASDHTTYGKIGTFQINLADSGIADKIAELEKAQKDDGYKTAMTTAAPTYFNALITGQALTDAQGTPISNGAINYLDVTVALNVVDNTDISLNAVQLEKPDITFNITRTLSGNRKNPTIVYTVDSGIDTRIQQTASFSPDYYTKDAINWYLSNDLTSATTDGDFGTLNDGTLKIEPDSQDYHLSNLSLVGITASSASNSFVSHQVQEDYTNFQSQMYKVPDTVYTYKKGFKISAKDKQNLAKTACCVVTVTFKTVDNTEIMPEEIAIKGLKSGNFNITSKSDIKGYNITYNYETGINSGIATRRITLNDQAQTAVVNGVGGTLQATLTPLYDPDANNKYAPYDKGISYSIVNKDASSSFTVPNAVLIDSTTGAITVRGYNADTTGNGYSPWIDSILRSGKLSDTREFTVIAKSHRDNTIIDSVDIRITFTATTNAKVTYNANSASGISGTMNPTYIVNGASTKLAKNTFSKSGSYAFSSWNTSSDGKGTSYNNEAEVTFLNDTTLYAMWKYTGSTGGGGGGGGTGGGGGGTGGVTPTGKTAQIPGSYPPWVTSGGTWIQDGAGHWLYTKDRTYKSEWAALANPYADTAKGQRAYDWFRFDANGWMVTGWFVDPLDGQTYYLQEKSDGSQGKMVTGWCTINGKDYYFNDKEGSGTMGALLRNTTTPDGHTVNADGVKIR